MPKIWSYGFINMDVITQTVDAWPEWSGLVWTDRIEFKIGGVALNPAVTVARLGGLPVGIIGYVGTDKAGQMVKSELEQAGIDTSRLIVSQTQPTGVCIVCVHSDGERSFIISSGANHNLRTEAVGVEQLTPGDFFHVGGAFSMSGLAALLEQVREQQLTVSVDVAFDSSGRWWARMVDLFPHIDIFMANASESQKLTGTTNPARAAQKIAAEGPQTVIIKQGKNGAYILAPTWQGQVPPFAVEVVDTTGAGDAFAGSFLYGLATGWGVEQAGTLAGAVGALCVTTPGATEGVVSYAQTVNFINAQGRTGPWNWS